MIKECKNRHNQKIVFELSGDLSSDNLVFIVHGLGGSKDQKHIQTISKAFVEAGFKAVAVDTTTGFGDSEGDTINVSATSYLQDLEDVVSFARTQDWFREPFVVAGHSLGGIATLLYANNHPEQVKGIFPMSTVVSGKLWRSGKSEAKFDEWEAQGYFLKVSKSMPGRSGKIGYGLARDLDKIDSLEFAPDIKCPALLIVGSEDPGTTPAMHEMLFAKLGGPKELHLIDKMGHDPTLQTELDELTQLIVSWAKKL